MYVCIHTHRRMDYIYTQADGYQIKTKRGERRDCDIRLSNICVWAFSDGLSRLRVAPLSVTSQLHVTFDMPHGESDTCRTQPSWCRFRHGFGSLFGVSVLPRRPISLHVEVLL